MPSRSEVVEVLLEVEGLEKTLARFPGMTRDDLRAILLGRAEQMSLFDGAAKAAKAAKPAKPAKAAKPAPAKPARTASAEASFASLNLWTDGASRGNPGPASIGVVIETPGGDRVDEVSEKIGVRTNNYAEYEAVRRGLRRALELKAKKIVLHADSELVVRQLNGVYRVKNSDLLPLYTAIKAVEREFPRGVTYKHVPREKNRDADALANLALDTE